MLIIRIWAGLGNQMFQYAFAKSFQLHSGKQVFLDTCNTYKLEMEDRGYLIPRDYLLNKFAISILPIDMKQKQGWIFLSETKWYHIVKKSLSNVGLYPYRVLSEKSGQNISRFHPEYLKMGGNVYAIGWFQTEKYFKDIRDILLKEFTLVKKIIIPDELQDILNERNAISVHIRRGDYKRNESLLLDARYYLDAINYIKRYIKNPVFIVFSDEMEWVKENISFEDKVIYIDQKLKLQDYEELMLMSKCKHNIIANSTFSWWGAWLNQNPEKIVVAPSKWGRMQKDIVPNEWIKI